MLDLAIVEGVRTPFAKVLGPLAPVPAHHLGQIATRAVLERAAVRADEIDQVVFGNGAPPPEASNPARVIALLAGIPQDRIAHTVQRNCGSGMEAVSTAAQILQLGEARKIVAGGTENMSQIPLLYNKQATALFIQLFKAKGWRQRLTTMLKFRPRHFKPVAAVEVGLTDPMTGLLMGGTAEILAEEFGISRQAQDEFALQSHQRASAAQERCVLEEEIVPVKTESTPTEVAKDVGPRADQSLEALARLKPFFKKDGTGTVTVGNSCQVTDGAAALVMMPGELALAEGRRPLGYLRGYAYAGCDPKRMGLGPVFATTKLFERTGLSLKDIDLIEINEAFAAQVLAVEKAFASEEFARKHLGRSHALGDIDPARLNVNGGAIALGHPVGATGVRLVVTLLKELRRRNLQRGLATLCIGGGQGAAFLLERSP
jgi:acetyl-CoA C-acetyltransferase/acetyl-CoA acyltransferase